MLCTIKFEKEAYCWSVDKSKIAKRYINAGWPRIQECFVQIRKEYPTVNTIYVKTSASNEKYDEEDSDGSGKYVWVKANDDGDWVFVHEYCSSATSEAEGPLDALNRMCRDPEFLQQVVKQVVNSKKVHKSFTIISHFYRLFFSVLQEYFTLLQPFVKQTTVKK